MGARGRAWVAKTSGKWCFSAMVASRAPERSGEVSFRSVCSSEQTIEHSGLRNFEKIFKGNNCELYIHSYFPYEQKRTLNTQECPNLNVPTQNENVEVL